MRFLPERRDHDCQSFPRQKSESQRIADSAGHVQRTLPLFHARPHASRHRQSAPGDGAMTKTAAAKTAPALTAEALASLERAGFSRRSFLQGAGALIVTFSTAKITRVGNLFAQGRGRGGPADPTIPNPQQLDSWIAIGA